jgi:hypothetical protein
VPQRFFSPHRGHTETKRKREAAMLGRLPEFSFSAKGVKRVGGALDPSEFFISYHDMSNGKW